MHAPELLQELEQLKARINELSGALKQNLVRETLATEQASVLLCRVGNEQCGLMLDSVAEVLMACRLSAIPEAPPWVCGLLNLHGRMVPVVDVQARMMHSPRPMELNDMIIIVLHQGKHYGLLVQQVFNVVEFASAALQQAAGDLPQAPYVVGTFTRNSQPIFLLSIACLLSSSTLPEIEQ